MRGANRASRVTGWARRRISRADHCTKVVLKNCAPEPSDNTLTLKWLRTLSVAVAFQPDVLRAQERQPAPAGLRSRRLP